MNDSMTKRYLALALPVLVAIFFALPLLAQGKSVALHGVVYLDGNPTKGIDVRLEPVGRQVKTNKSGRYIFSPVVPGTYTVVAQLPGGDLEKAVVTVGQTNKLQHFYFNTKTGVLGEVAVTAVRKTDRLRLDPIKTEVIDVSQFHEKATNIQNLLNASPGVRLRNTGDVGARNEITINGFSGRSIKLMRDGIPIDYLGSSFGLTKIPVNAVERIEVYKGVLPTEIGIDALGGAINLVSKTPQSSEVELSYNIGSFGSNIATLNAMRRMGRHISVGVYAFGNLAKNDYPVKNLPITDEATGRNMLIEARLFHNGFKQYHAEGFVNVEQLSWADLIQFRLTSFGLHHDIQNDFTTRNQPYGQAFRREHAKLIPSLTYRKSLFEGKLNATLFGVYSHINNNMVDTLRNTYYDWRGVPHKGVASSGEMSGGQKSIPGKVGLESNSYNTILRSLLNLALTSEQNLTLNVMYNHVRFIRDDYDAPSYLGKYRYDRLIAGLGHSGAWWNGRLNTILQAKLITAQTHDDTYNEPAVFNKGVSLSLSGKYDVTPRFLLRSSFEKTYRMPDRAEIFGDNTFIVPNLKLAPEQSKNFNIGLKWHKPGQYNLELNSYFRHTENLIKMKEINQYQGQFLNLQSVKGFGLEMDGYIRLFSAVKVHGNLTYNEFRYNGSMNNMQNDNHYKDARISNAPFFYANLGVEYAFKNLFGKRNNTLKTYWQYSYVHQYYLDFIERRFEPDGFLGLFGESKINTNRIIPNQHVHTIGTSYDTEIGKHRVKLGLEVRNLFDREVYNHFKMQNAGRSIWAKMVYLIR